jgi:hypothetical protein
MESVMSQHYLLVAVLDEMDRLTSKLRGIVEAQPEDWKEGYTSYRRQLGLSITEMVKLAKHDLGMSREDAGTLKAEFEACRAAIARHQEAYPMEDIVLSAPGFIESFNRVDACFLGFRATMQRLIERYEVEFEGID